MVSLVIDINIPDVDIILFVLRIIYEAIRPSSATHYSNIELKWSRTSMNNVNPPRKDDPPKE